MSFNARGAELKVLTSSGHRWELFHDRDPNLPALFLNNVYVMTPDGDDASTFV